MSLIKDYVNYLEEITNLVVLPLCHSQPTLLAQNGLVCCEDLWLQRRMGLNEYLSIRFQGYTFFYVILKFLGEFAKKDVSMHHFSE